MSKRQTSAPSAGAKDDSPRTSARSESAEAPDPSAGDVKSTLEGFYNYTGPRRDYDLPGGGIGTLYPGANYAMLPAGNEVIDEAIRNGLLRKIG